MWSDEYHSFKVSSLPFAQIITGNYIGDLNPPLYALVLRTERLLLCDSEFCMRMLSLTFSLVALLLLYLFTLITFHSAIPRFLALSLVAFHPMMIYYSVEIRPYSLLLLLSSTIFFAILKTLTSDNHHNTFAIILGLSLIGCLYTHHFGIIVFASIVGFILFCCLRQNEESKKLILALCSSFAAFVAYAPGLLILRKHILAYSRSTDVSSSLSNFNLFLFSIDHPNYEKLVVLVLYLLLLFGLINLFREFRSNYAKRLLLVVIATHFASSAILIKFGMYVSRRYLIVLGMLLLLVVASSYDSLRLRPLLAVIVCTIAVALNTLYGIDFVMNTKNESVQVGFKADWKRISEVVEQLRSVDEYLVIMGWDATPIQYYSGIGAMSSYDFERKVEAGEQGSYLVVMSPKSRTLAFLDSAELLYQDPAEGVRILRWRVEGPDGSSTSGKEGQKP